MDMGHGTPLLNEAFGTLVEVGMAHSLASALS
jgi:hypothetical protein